MNEIPSRRKLRLRKVLNQRYAANAHQNSPCQFIYSNPVDSSIILEKHRAFIDRWKQTVDNATSTFRKNDLDIPLKYRLVSILPIDQLDRLHRLKPIRIPQLRINELHFNRYLSLRIVSKPLWTRYAVHIIVQDETIHCLRLSIYNWSYTFEHRQCLNDSYIEERLIQLLPIHSTCVLFDPWLKRCDDGDIALRCESPNIDLFLLNFQSRCSLGLRTNIEDLRRWGNQCYAANDSLGAIEFYTFALQQLNEQTFVSADGRTNLLPIEREKHRVRLLSNRSACYIRERYPDEALEDTEIYTHSPLPDITEKLVQRRCIAQMYLGHYEEAEQLSKQYLSSMELIKDIHRLQQNQYDLPSILENQSSSSIFHDIEHYHREYRRIDLFEIRLSSEQSYGAYALQKLQAGTLLLVESPFVSIEKSLVSDRLKQSINSWHRSDHPTRLDYCSDDVLRLLNEVEKKLLIGQDKRMTFDRIQLMQPIRQWIAEHTTSQNIPWRLLFETQQQNPFQSNSTLAWYTIGSMFNHACLPNCLWYLIDGYLFIYVCASTIDPGEELTISYCPLWISSYKERKARLRSFGIFTCHCSLCTYDRAVYRCKQNKTIDRPVGFIHALTDQESLEEFASTCRLNLHTLPQIDHPLFLFGSHLLLLLDKVRHQSLFETNNQWQCFFDELFRLFSCHSPSSTSSSSSSEAFERFFRRLIHTQTLLSLSVP